MQHSSLWCLTQLRLRVRKLIQKKISQVGGGGWMIGSDYYNINIAPFEPGLWLCLENECSIALFGAWSHPIRAGARLNKIFPGGLIVSCEWLVFGVCCWVVGSDKIKANSAHL